MPVSPIAFGLWNSQAHALTINLFIRRAFWESRGVKGLADRQPITACQPAEPQTSHTQTLSHGTCQMQDEMCFALVSVFAASSHTNGHCSEQYENVRLELGIDRWSSLFQNKRHTPDSQAPDIENCWLLTLYAARCTSRRLNLCFLS